MRTNEYTIPNHVTAGMSSKRACFRLADLQPRSKPMQWMIHPTGPPLASLLSRSLSFRQPIQAPAAVLPTSNCASDAYCQSNFPHYTRARGWTGPSSNTDAVPEGGHLQPWGRCFQPRCHVSIASWHGTLACIINRPTSPVAEHHRCLETYDSGLAIRFRVPPPPPTRCLSDPGALGPRVMRPPSRHFSINADRPGNMGGGCHCPVIQSRVSTPMRRLRIACALALVLILP
ncbi:hypothetical protein LX36DRAFT_65311 [Colletotrichum falcatum]|nr:hypothetical protein LX36DRAFT_65311 [Colletotrichum falcatum]